MEQASGRERRPLMGEEGQCGEKGGSWESSSMLLPWPFSAQASLQGTEQSAGDGVKRGSQAEGPVPSGGPGAWHSETVRAHLSMNE